MGGASTTLVRSLLSMMKCANSPFQSTRASMIAVLLFACACSASYEAVVNTPEDHHSQMVHPDVDGLNEMELGQYQPKYYGDYGHRGWHIRGGFNHQQWGRKLNGAKKYQTTGEWYHSGRRKGKQGPDVQMYGEHGYGHWRYGYRKKSMRHGYGQPMVGAWRQGWSDYFN